MLELLSTSIFILNNIFRDITNVSQPINDSYLWIDLQANNGINLFQNFDLKMNDNLSNDSSRDLLNMDDSPQNQYLIKTELLDLNEFKKPCSSITLNKGDEKPKFCAICGDKTKCYHYGKIFKKSNRSGMERGYKILTIQKVKVCLVYGRSRPG
jgi:hypothetical protein